MASDVISRIKDRLDIVEVISSYLKLQKSGINYKARCPFHNEKTGSFFVSPERQIWHCFGCSAGGDIFGFVKQIEGVEFPEALRILATRAGVQLTPQSPEYQQFQSVKTRLYEVCELATKFFEKQLYESATGKKVIEYLKSRGVGDDPIKSFRLGYAPDSWNALGDFLVRKFSVQEQFQAGLTVQSQKNPTRFYDRFRSRIVFPITDLNGQVVGFSGRVFGANSAVGADGGKEPVADVEPGAKYINTPQTPIYDKSRVLYGLDKARLGIRHQNRCIVVEGNLDVIMSHQAGVTNAVASSGTALTDSHLKIIKRYTDNLDLCFDTDAAGSMATDRGVDLALARGFNVAVIAFEEDLKDPADYVQKHGSAWVEFVKNSKPFMEFFFEAAKKKFDITTALGKKMIAQKLLPLMASFTNKVEQAHWVSEISLALKIKEDVLLEELAKILPKDPGLTEGAALNKEAVSSRLGMVEESLISLALKQPELAATIKPENALFLSEQCRQIISMIDELHSDNEAEVIEYLSKNAEPSLKMSLEIIYLKAQELWRDFENIEMTREFDNLLAHAKKHYISSQLEKLEYDIKEAEKKQDKVLLASLIAEFSKIAKELGN